jgi:hypothetical protein
MATTMQKDLPIWARQRPSRLGATQPLTAAQKRTAKARAAAAGRKYPNLIDNIAAARNPTMKPASPAQLAARKRFAEMARSGAFKKATKRKTNPLIISAEADKSLGYYGSRGYIRKLLEDWADTGRVVSVRKKRGSNAIGVAFSGGKVRTLEEAKIYLENLVNEGILKPSPVKPFRMNNPASGSNARKGIYILEYKGFEVNEPYDTGLISNFPILFANQNDAKKAEQRLNDEYGEDIYKSRVRKITAKEAKSWADVGYDVPKPNPAKKTVSQKISQLRHEGYPQRQAVAVALSEQRAGKVKRNPMHQYTVLHRGTANLAGQVTASGPQAAKQKVAEKLGIPTLAYLVAKKTNPANVKQITEFKGHKDYTGYAVREPGSDKYIAVFASKKQAVALAQNQADYHNKNMEVARIQLVRTK